MIKPLEIVIERGGRQESVHLCNAVAITSDGFVKKHWGNARIPIFPHSLLKPIQAVPLVSTGAAAQYNLSEREIALAASSHFGTHEHLIGLSSWMAKVGVSQDDLQCGLHEPFDRETANRMARHGEAVTPLHNNNSGKHLSMITLCRNFDWCVRTYTERSHPVQSLIKNTVSRFTNSLLPDHGSCIDMGNTPTEPIELESLALGLARLCDCPDLSDAENAAARRILRAMRTFPEMIAKPGRLSTELMRITRGKLIAKAGAEGGFAVVSENDRLCVVIKVIDGAYRASEQALLWTLCSLNLVSGLEKRKLRDAFPGTLHSYDGRLTGRISVSC